jgi:hypothetical protein
LPNAVERIWPGETVVCIASGPSLTREDCELVRGKARVIAINNSYQLAPFADALYACDARWWKWHKGAKDFHGLTFALERRSAQYRKDITVLKVGKPEGLSLDPMYLNTGKNSGYQALNLSVLMGASRVILLGYDMQRGPKGEMHWHPEHPMKTPHMYVEFRRRFESLIEPMRTAGVEVINCTRSTALECFPKRPLEQMFSAQERAA